jgi:hypothetical protein
MSVVIPTVAAPERRGDRIFVFGTVEHEWDDVYDFEERGLPHLLAERVPYTRPFVHLGNLARTAQDSGRARPYTTHARWTQGFLAELKLSNGAISPVRFEWRDLEPASGLR